jgi:hypothetical protein
LWLCGIDDPFPPFVSPDINSSFRSLQEQLPEFQHGKTTREETPLSKEDNDENDDFCVIGGITFRSFQCLRQIIREPLSVEIIPYVKYRILDRIQK